jgi:hypothetical protein
LLEPSFTNLSLHLAASAVGGWLASSGPPESSAASPESRGPASVAAESFDPASIAAE